VARYLLWKAVFEVTVAQSQEKNMAQKKSLIGFPRFAKAAATAVGSPMAFAIAVLIVLVWAVTGPLFGYSDTWQLVINTGTTIITFLIVFLIQNTQTRDTEALQLKLDELIRATKGARNALLDLEDMDDEHLERLRKVYERLAKKETST
jgi:low affinity Fe/Cu permease